MKIQQLLEASLQPNAYFTVEKPLKAWRHVGFRPTNNYYGATQLYGATYEPITLERGDEVHWLHGGLFAVTGREGFMIRLTAPTDSSPFERSSGDHRARQISKLVDAATLLPLDAKLAKKVKYVSPE